MKSPFKATLVSSLVLTALGLTSLAHAAPPGSLRPNKDVDGLIVKYRTVDLNTAFTAQGERNAKAAAADLTGRTGYRLNFKRRIHNGAQVLTTDSNSLEDAKALAERLKAEDSNIEYAEPNLIMQAYAVPNDSRYREMWHLFEAAGGIRVEGAWDITNGAGQRVAVLDTGYRPHADLAANIVGGYDMITNTTTATDGNGRDSDAKDTGDWYNAAECGDVYDSDNSFHGTHVAGTIAAVGNNSSGVIGVAYGAKVVPVRVLGKCGGSTADIADGIVWAAGGQVGSLPLNANPVGVINMSLGGRSSCSSTYQNAINSARAKGVTVVIASGNSNDNAANYTPGNCSGVINVAATDREGDRASYSNYGSLIDIAAPGGVGSEGPESARILSTHNSGTRSIGSDSYYQMAGTSMAAPHVAGVVALIKSVNPSLTPDQIEALIKETARPLQGNGCRLSDGTTSTCGAGIIDANAAVTRARGGVVTPPPSGSSELTNGVAKTNLSVASGAEQVFTLKVPSGAKDLVVATSGGTGDADLYVKFGSSPTDSSYDCRPYRSGNAESCTVAAPSAGTYYVRVKGYTSVSGLTLKGSYTTGTSTTPTPTDPLVYTNSTSYSIPDNSRVGIVSPLTVTRSGASGTVKVDVNIAHTYIGDLTVSLIAPNGATSVLHNQTGGTTNNLVQSYSVNAGTVDSKGQWQLKVVDSGYADVGTIKSFKLTFAQ